LFWLETLAPASAGDPQAADLLRRSASALSDGDVAWPIYVPQTPIEYAAEAIASEAKLVAAADRRSVWERLIGDDGGDEQIGWQVAASRLRAQLDVHSVWLRTSIRGAVALALAVAVAGETGVQHGFWVTFGALAVLRTTALATGQNVLRALIGTAIGIAAGSAIIVPAGHHHPTLWSVLPVAVLFTGVAPTVVGFVAGQAGFTITILVIFALVGPTHGIGLVRFEDVALGCGVSFAAGLVLWPRGSATALSRTLAEALDAAAGELSAHVRGGPAVSSDAARERLDGAFRQLLAESGSKPGTLAELSSAVMAPSVLSLTVRSLAGQASNAAVHAEAAALADWFRTAAAALSGGPLPAAPPAASGDPSLTGLRLLAARTRPSLVALAQGR
jgi:uncharacterized membrane protein YccC